MQTSNQTKAKYDSNLHHQQQQKAHRVDLLQFEDTFILDINKNKRILISGTKQDLMLPKVSTLGSCPILRLNIFSIFQGPRKAKNHLLDSGAVFFETRKLGSTSFTKIKI